MTRLDWGTAGSRFYEIGADRGVLFPPTGPGVAWTGLTAVNEAPNGGEAQPFYVDGYKYANVSAFEEFGATLEAFGCPPEFAVCDGSAQIYPGLFITHQPRKPFGLSYRTLVGNDVEGAEYGYKLHLVYNVLASPSSKSNVTVTDTPEPTKYSWPLTAKPPRLAGYKPSAHLVIDSRTTPKNLLKHIEDILYGAAFVDPRLPSQDEIVAIFASPGPVIRRNYTKDARGKSTSYWAANVSSTEAVYLTGGPTEDLQTYWEATSSVGSPGFFPYIQQGLTTTDHPGILYPANTPVHVMIWFRSSIAGPFRLRLIGTDMSTGTPTTALIDLAPQLSSVNVPANTWTLFEKTFNTDAPTTNAYPRIELLTPSSLVIGQKLAATGVLVEYETTGPFFDKDTPDANGITYESEGVLSVARSWGDI